MTNGLTEQQSHTAGRPHESEIDTTDQEDTDTTTAHAYQVALGERLRTVREQRRLSLAQMEEQTGGRFTAAAVGSYERGARAVSVARLAEMAEFYQVPVAKLLPDTPAKAPGMPTADDLRRQREHLTRPATSQSYANATLGHDPTADNSGWIHPMTLSEDGLARHREERYQIRKARIDDDQIMHPRRKELYLDRTIVWTNDLVKLLGVDPSRISALKNGWNNPTLTKPHPSVLPYPAVADYSDPRWQPRWGFEIGEVLRWAEHWLYDLDLGVSGTIDHLAQLEKLAEILHKGRSRYGRNRKPTPVLSRVHKAGTPRKDKQTKDQPPATVGEAKRRRRNPNTTITRTISTDAGAA